MKLRFDDATEAFRTEFSHWLDANLPDPSETTERPRSTAHVPQWLSRQRPFPWPPPHQL